MPSFTSECELCAELLTDYISAGNEILETRERLHDRPEPSSEQLAAALIDRALKRRKRARQRFLIHQEQQH